MIYACVWLVFVLVYVLVCVGVYERVCVLERESRERSEKYVSMCMCVIREV